MNCPNCKNPMRSEHYEGVQIDRCNTCGGTWLDEGELRQVVQQTNTTFTDEEKMAAMSRKGQDQRERKPLPCPKCKATMTTFQYLYNSGVFIDSCPAGHGIYLDNHELSMVQILMEENQLRSGTHPTQNEITDLSEQRRCPRDGMALTEVSYEGERVDQCPKCRGIWCDDGELQQIVNRREIRFSSSQKQAAVQAQRKATERELIVGLRCVDCGKPMIRSNYAYTSGILLDYCPSGHGVWLDHGEIEQIQAFAEQVSDEAHEHKEKYAKMLRAAGAEARQKHKAPDVGRKRSPLERFVGLLIDKGVVG